MRRATTQGALIGLVLAAGLLLSYPRAAAQSGAAQVPFKLGTFERSGQAFLGLVLRDSQVVDIARANAALETRDAAAKKLSMPGDMKSLISRYEAELKGRLSAIASDVAGAKSAPPYVYALTSLKTLPPVMPSLILMAAANYTEHAQGIAQQQQKGAAAPPPAPKVNSAPGIWERKPGDQRNNPYLFMKSPTVVIGTNDPIVAPPGRERLDFECELSVVIGKPASRVPLERAADYIFGYTAQIDVSDRGGRGDTSMGGSDWLIGKNHDTFGPVGPFIVPKEFVKDPMNLRQTFTLNGQVMQDSYTSRMSHNVFELLQYASNILTLRPGDLIAAGSPAGTNIERAQPRWMRAGDNAVCTLEGIGSLTHAVVAAK